MEILLALIVGAVCLVAGFALARAFPGAAAEKLRAEHEAAIKRVVELETTLAAEAKAHEEKLALLTGAKDQMKLEFQAMAGEIMKTHSTAFSEQNKKQIEVLLNPLREHINVFQKELKTAHHESTVERTTLATQIKSLTQASATMLAETTNLTRALKGEAQTQGAWGEMILESILAKSGLREGEEYVVQQSHGTADGGRLRTDLIVRLPSGERVIVDSKVSLTAFEAYVKAENEQERAQHLKAHLASMRAHIKTLSAKDYVAAAGSGLDYVIMFVPIEGALAAALQADPGLTSHAVESNVPIATPTTLMIALRTVANLWKVERRNRNAEAIADRAGKLYEKFVGFVGDLQKVGASLDQAKKNYDESFKKLSSGTGNIVRQVEQLKDMGAKTTKALPPELLADSADEPVVLELGAPRGTSAAE
jgi:DNA recombination protein RmuC